MAGRKTVCVLYAVLTALPAFAAPPQRSSDPARFVTIRELTLSGKSIPSTSRELMSMIEACCRFPSMKRRCNHLEVAS